MISGQIFGPISDYFTNLFSRKALNVVDRAEEVRNQAGVILDKVRSTFSVTHPIDLAPLILAPENNIRTLSSYLRCQDGCVVLSDSAGSSFSLDVLQNKGPGLHPIKKKWANPTGYGKGKEFQRSGSVYLMKGSSKFPGYLVFSDNAKGFFCEDYSNRGTVEIWVKGGAEVYVENLDAKTIIVHATGSGAKLTIKKGLARKLYVRADIGTTVDLGGVKASHVIINPARGLSDNITVCPLTKYSQLGGAEGALSRVTLATDSALTAPTIISLKKYKAKRFVANTIPQYFKRTINATLLAGGLVFVGAAVLTFLSSFVMGFELAVGSTEYFDKVQNAFSAFNSSGGPGDVVRPNGDILHPDGTITHPEGTFFQPNGDLLRVSNGDLIHPDGSVSHLNGSVTGRGGTITYPSGTVLQDNGDLLRSSNGDLIHPDGSVSHLNGSVTGRGGTITYPSGTVLQDNGDLLRVSNGDLIHPDGEVSHLNGSVTETDGTIRYPSGTVLRDNGDLFRELNGDIIHPDGSVTHLTGIRHYLNGDLGYSNGDIFHPDGTVTHRNGTITRLNGDIYNPVTKDVTHLNGSISHEDGSLTRVNGDVVQPNGDIRHQDGSTTGIDGVRIYSNGDKRLPDGTSIIIGGTATVRPNGVVVFADGRMQIPSDTVLQPNGELLRTSNGDLIQRNGVVRHADGSLTEIDGDVFRPDGTILRNDRSIVLVNGDVRYANGNVFHKNGSITLLNRDIRYPNGNVLHPDGTTTYPGGITR